MPALLSASISGPVSDALTRLLPIAQSDTGQSRRVANFLLAWWNASTCGGWDLVDLWCVDVAIAEDMLVVLRALGPGGELHRTYPNELGYRDDFETIMRRWRPHLMKGE